MDPNANLLKQRNLATRLLYRPVLSAEQTHADAMRLAELVLALDEWLTNGGFKPRGWD